MKKIIFTILIFLAILDAKESQQSIFEIAAEDNTIGLGLLHLYNDKVKAKFLFERSCESNYMLGCLNLGELYIKNKEYDKAKEILEKTCNSDLPKGCYELGKLHLGSSKESNIIKSLYFFKKSCSLEYADACFATGATYYQGIPNQVAVNFKLAKEFFNKSCSLGHKFGCEYEKKCE